jgi:hypothetical protein
LVERIQLLQIGTIRQELLVRSGKNMIGPKFCFFSGEFIGFTRGWDGAPGFGGAGI